ncbi:MAG: hypothetical protein ISS19_03490 [Bacteroidales bacterium]|nr:hypothetical protein [Bacteroidales bacterium]
MKKLIVILIVCMVGLNVSAQMPDSVLIQELKKEVKMLKKEAKGLKYQVSTLKKQHQEDLEKIKTSLDENAGKVGDLKNELDGTNGALAEHQQSSDERIGVLEAWTKKMLMILIIMFGILFIVLLILVLMNRSAVKKNFIKLEAKVENVKEEHSIAHKELEKKYLAELEELKKGFADKK